MLSSLRLTRSSSATPLVSRSAAEHFLGIVPFVTSPGDRSLTLRTATVDDAPALSELAAASFIATFGPDNPPEAIDEYVAEALSVEVIEGQIADTNSTWIVAEDADGAAGFAHVKTGTAPREVSGDRPMQLSRLYARPDRIGKGVGAALMQDCVDRAAAVGCDALWLGVWEHNERALAFYRRWGMEPVGSMIFRLGDDDQTDLVLVRPLP